MLFKLMFTSFENGTGYLLAGNVKFEFGMKVEEMFTYLRVFCENWQHVSHTISVHNTTGGSDCLLFFFYLQITMSVSHLGLSHLVCTIPSKDALHKKTLFHVWENWDKIICWVTTKECDYRSPKPPKVVFNKSKI